MVSIPAVRVRYMNKMKVFEVRFQLFQFPQCG